MGLYLRSVAVLALTGGLLAFFLRSANLGQVWLEFGAGDPAWLGLTCLLTAATYLLRAARWQLLLRPLGAVRFGSALQATIIGFGLSALLPARPGEIVRPYVLARREGISATAAFATVLLERLLDLVAVLLLFGGCLMPIGVGVATSGSGLLRAIQIGGMLSAAAAVAFLGLAVVLAGKPDALNRMLDLLRRVLPGRVGDVAARLTGRFTAGLGVVRQPQGLAGAFLYSLANWGSVALGIWTVASAYRLDVPLRGSVILLVLLVVGVSVPTPGGIGGFHAAFQVGATTLYGVPPERAAVAAIILHAISFVPVAALSLVLMAREGLSFRTVRQLAARREAPARPEPVEGEAAREGSAP